MNWLVISSFCTYAVFFKLLLWQTNTQLVLSYGKSLRETVNKSISTNILICMKLHIQKIRY